VAKKELLVVAGPNGAGKSTFVTGLLSHRPRPYLCADLIATEFANLEPFKRQIVAGREFLRRTEEQLSMSQDFIIETTMSGRTLRGYLQRAKMAGFSVTIVFIYLSSANHCILRVQQRVRRGGHNVPEEDIRRRFVRSCVNFWHIYRQIADQWEILYNSTGRYVEVAIGVGDELVVSTEGDFNTFLAFAEGEVNG
jgi:predicted ABC-type ATPase